MEANQVKRAIYQMGGATLAGNKLHVSTNTVHKWVRAGVVPRLDKAEQVSLASGIDVAMLRPRFEK